MSLNIVERPDLIVTLFYGGKVLGPCIRITRGIRWAQLSMPEFEGIVRAYCDHLGIEPPTMAWPPDAGVDVVEKTS